MIPRVAARLAGAALTLLLQPAPAGALVVDGSDGAGTEKAPDPDPGWRNVGEREGRSAVYLGDGWVLTAEHVGVGPVVFDGVTSDPVPGSRVRLSTPGAGGGDADLVMFRVDPRPKLRGLKLRRIPVRPGDPLILVGYGRGRGAPTTWRGRRGFETRSGAMRRWGTNRAERERFTLRAHGSATRCFDTAFTPGGDGTEAQAQPGDSGGAVFARGAKLWRLSGIMIAIEHPLQPKRTAFYGDRTAIADLSHYRDQIRQVMGRTGGKPSRREGMPRDGPAAGLAPPEAAPDDPSPR